MAINYNKVGWDTTKYFNPSNMNHMDDGIKAACDKADANESAISSVSDRVTNNEKAIEQVNSNFDYGSGLPEPQTGGYGSYANVVAGFQRQGNIFNIVFKGQVTGVVDFYYTSFGIEAKYKLPTSVFGELINIITVDGASGGKLYVKAGENALQLSASSSDTFFFSACLILERS